MTRAKAFAIGTKTELSNQGLFLRVIRAAFASDQVASLPGSCSQAFVYIRVWEQGEADQGVVTSILQ